MAITIFVPHIRTESHPVGTRVAKPLTPNGCWATIDAVYSTPLKAPRNCACRARGKRLCCVMHQKREPEAKSLKEKLDAAGK